MKVALLFSGGKDSTFAGYLAKKYNHEIVCLVTIRSQNDDSFMFHTPSIAATEKQAEVMGVPIIVKRTKGEKEKELKDLEFAIKKAVRDYGVEGVVTGAVESVYQAVRVQKICDKLGIDCFNPLWQKNQFDILDELIKNNFEVIVTGVFAEGFDESWLGRKIDKSFIDDVKKLFEKYKINPAGEGGEFESFVLNCPIFEKGLEVSDSEKFSDVNSHRMEVLVK